VTWGLTERVAISTADRRVVGRERSSLHGKGLRNTADALAPIVSK
jgi:hypothetical protein